MSNRAATWILCLSLCGLTAALNAGERPARVVSVNLCSDQLLLMLADADQVASVSYLSREPLSSFVADQARRYPANHARAEEVIAYRPDLVLATAYTSPRLITTLETLGYPVERLSLGHSLAQIRAGIRHLAQLLGQPARGEALIRGMQSAIPPAQTPAPLRPTALFYQPRGYTSGRDTLQDEALRLAGWRNLSAEQGIEGYAPLDLEQLLVWRPQRIFTSAYGETGESLAQRQLKHPALARLPAGRQMQQIPYKYWICPGPMLADAIDLLRRARPLPPAADPVDLSPRRGEDGNAQ